MRLNQLLASITTEALPHFEITNVTEDTRRADANSLFVCIRGARFDGHALAVRAYENGCRCFVAEAQTNLPDDATVVTVPSTRRALAKIACTFHNEPSHKLHVIGITGTKGKTTTASLISSVLNDNGIPCGYIGTNGITYKDVKKQTLNTTPDPLTLQRTLAEMLDAGMKAVAIEVSSQAILQDRVFGTYFQTTVFTNFSEDHIGPNEHATLEDYKECKHRLFTDFPAVFSVWNADDPTAKEMQCGALATTHLCYSIQNRAADFTAKDVLPTIKHGRTGISFSVSHKDKTEECHLPLIGVCNVSNAICTAAVAVGVFGISLASTAASLSRAVVAGRSEAYPLPSGAIAVIDYAHNKESLSQVLHALREYHPKRILCLFGSVGERTQLRRRDLAEVAAELADACILTSDNPGNEPPEQIIDEIASFLPTSYPHQKIVDRGDAIRTALRMLQNGDILLLAGKGHENYQLIGSTKIPFDERKILEEFLSTPALI